MDYHVELQEEDGVYWAHVRELPGCFASGRTLDELKDALIEAIELYRGEGSDAGAASALRLHELLVSAR